MQVANAKTSFMMFWEKIKLFFWITDFKHDSKSGEIRADYWLRPVLHGCCLLFCSLCSTISRRLSIVLSTSSISPFCHSIQTHTLIVYFMHQHRRNEIDKHQNDIQITNVSLKCSCQKESIYIQFFLAILNIPSNSYFRLILPCCQYSKPCFYRRSVPLLANVLEPNTFPFNYQNNHDFCPVKVACLPIKAILIHPTCRLLIFTR